MKLSDLFDHGALGDAISAGYVRVQHHLSEPLAILNYTPAAAYGRVWNPVTLTCRGLIYNTDTLEVVARPFPKFFNYGESCAPDVNPSESVTITDKLDGSLGILYPVPSGGYAIATRGSFTSEQALHATELYQSRYSWYRPNRDLTYLFEIIYPANRIVVDYGDRDAIVLLGTVDTESGRSFGPSESPILWPGQRTAVLPYHTFAEALFEPPRPGAEGLVVHFTESDTRLKLKQDDYVALHRILTGFTARRLWERAAVWATLDAVPDATPDQLGKWLKMDPNVAAQIVAAGPEWLDRTLVPEEFLDWVDTTLRHFVIEISAIIGLVNDAVRVHGAHLRPTLARLIANHPYRALIFSTVDGRDITAAAWLRVYPPHEVPFRTETADV